jgi:hypothetical protein
MIKCPETGRWISTGIDVDPETYPAIPEALAKTRCQACGQDHWWSKKDALICEFATTGSQSEKDLFKL